MKKLILVATLLLMTISGFAYFTANGITDIFKPNFAEGHARLTKDQLTLAEAKRDASVKGGANWLAANGYWHLTMAEVEGGNMESAMVMLDKSIAKLEKSIESFETFAKLSHGNVIDESFKTKLLTFDYRSFGIGKNFAALSPVITYLGKGNVADFTYYFIVSLDEILDDMTALRTNMVNEKARNVVQMVWQLDAKTSQLHQTGQYSSQVFMY